ncbi:hypothetical protein FRB96_004649 [Tulasnella sp. 330]|nr:hypothetical protein FRB96_004649 [Tulasnella sp. 330]
MGSALGARYKQTGRIDDLVQHIHHQQEALLLCTIEHPLRPSTLHSLGIALQTRFDQTGDAAHLGMSIKYQQEVLSFCPTDHPGRSSVLNNLGIALQKQFDRTGGPGDLGMSIEYHQEALLLRPIDHPGRSGALNNLGIAIHKRFDQTGDPADLNMSIEYHKEALALRPLNHPSRSSALNNLGIALQKRFHLTNDATNLDMSIKYHEEDLLLHPIGHPGRSATLNSLGIALHKRFDQTRDAADLDASIEYHQEDLLLHPIGRPGRSLPLNNLGIALRKRFDQMGDPADFEMSIKYHQEDLSICPIGHPNRALILNSLGLSLEAQSRRKGDMADFEDCIRYYREGSEYVLSSLSHRQVACNNWIKAARRYRSESLGDAYKSSLDLLDRSLLLAASTLPDTHSRLRGNRETVTEDATSDAIGKHELARAVEISERGRALLFTQLGNYRTPLYELQAVDNKLADRFRELSTSMEESSLSGGGGKIGGGAMTDHVGRRQRLAVEWDRTLQAIRELNGFENFLGVTPFTQLRRAANNGPVILVNISQYGSNAIIIHKTGEPISVTLPEATPTAIEALVRTLRQTTGTSLGEKESYKILETVLRDIWTKIVEPVVFQLENMLKVRRWSRIWWITTSLASLLPLHAAGVYVSGGRNLPDRFVSSYAITLSSLLRSRAGHPRRKNSLSPRILVVAQSGAEGEQQLPMVHHEVVIIRSLPAEVTVIEGDDCTRDPVLTGLMETDWVHFACHGKQHPTEPFQSHFSLLTRDTSLTLLDIIKTGLPQGELAVLSACHSAAGDESTPDEGIHLTAGVLFTGFRSVIGTMWAMADEDGPVIAEEFYKYMFRRGPEAADCRDAADGLAKAIRVLRRRKVPLERWVNFVHYGI